MGPWQYYLVVLQEDLLALASLLLWTAGALLVHSALIAIAVAARHRRLRSRVIWGAILVAWLVSTVTAVGTYLLGLGLVAQFYRIWQVKLTEVPPYFWLALIGVSIVIAGVLSYRHTAAWIKAGLDDQPAPLRVRFSLGTLFLSQIILFLGIGLWIECRRDWVTDYQEKQRVAEHMRWEASIDERFGSAPWKIEHSKLNDPNRFLVLSVGQYHTDARDIPQVDVEVIHHLEARDQLTLLHFRCDDLDAEALRKLSQQQRLADLYMVSLNLTDADLKALKALPNLQHLILRCPQLTDRALDILAGMKADVWIESPLITQAGAESRHCKREGNWVVLSEMERARAQLAQNYSSGR